MISAADRRDRRLFGWVLIAAALVVSSGQLEAQRSDSSWVAYLNLVHWAPDPPTRARIRSCARGGIVGDTIGLVLHSGFDELHLLAWVSPGEWVVAGPPRVADTLAFG